MATHRTANAAMRGMQLARPSVYNSRNLPLSAYRQIHSQSKTARPALRNLAIVVPLIGIFLYGDSIRRSSQNISFEAQVPFANESPELVIEESKKRPGASKEEIRDLISSQHLQVKKSWENPGVYAWGSNVGKVVAPDSDEDFIKTPRRMPFFNGLLLRDLKLDKEFGAAITESGDLLQWGKGYSQTDKQPAFTLRGKNLVSVAILKDRVIALSKSGQVYSVPAAKADQEEGKKPTESSWIPFWSGKSPISYRLLEPETLRFGEKITAIAGGLEHALLLTNKGRVFSSAASSESFPSRGQLGIAGLTWSTRPQGAPDMCHEIRTLKGFDAVAVAAGDYHSLVLDKEGRVFAFGDNSSGQLGFEFSTESSSIDVPSLVPISRLYRSNQSPRTTAIFAGGLNSYFTIDATRVLGRGEDPSQVRDLGRVTADTWACGQGIRGGLGNGRWTHIQDTPTKIPSLSGLFEYDEIKNTTIPIRLSRISAGQSHVAATMKNVTHLDTTQKASENDTNWGADVVWWGANDTFQLGTGKKNNASSPIYIAPLDMEAEKEVGRDQKHRLHVTPKHKVTVNGKRVNMEQRVECGRNVTAIYSAV